MVTRHDLAPDEFHEYFSTYINRVEGELILQFSLDLTKTVQKIKQIDLNKHHYAYDKNKWTVLQLLQHCIDTERVFQFRAFSIARSEKQNIQGFNENEYADSTPSETLNLTHLIKEFTSLRQSTIDLFESFSDKNLNIIGHANHSPLSTRACGFIILGHWDYHLQILNERYL